MKLRTLVITLILIPLLIVLLPKFVRIAKVTIKVVDEESNPVKGAKIDIYLYRASPRNSIIKGKTNSDGMFSVSGYSANGVVGGVVEKESYYYSTFHHDFYVKKLGIWQPWNKELQVVIRPIVKPVPMYVRNRNYIFPADGTSLGFDLMKSEWLPPYGKGIHEDFIFRVERQFNNIDNFDATLTMSFPNEYDGIQEIGADSGGNFTVGSEFRLPRQAPESGYHNKWEKRVSAGSYGNRAAKVDGINYIYRVRSEMEDGKLKRAMYGKIRGDIRFGPAGEKAGFEMFYYLNPDYTRNLEFDPKRNLFTNLPEVEGVGLP